MTRILVSGLPRSGTTWLARTIAEAPGAIYVHEPDTIEVDPLAWVARRDLGFFPTLSPGDRADDYRLLWEFAFAGGWPERVRWPQWIRNGAAKRQLPFELRAALLRFGARRIIARGPITEHQVVKSVFSVSTLEWLAEEFHPTVIVTWRHPLNLVPSWQERGWPVHEYRIRPVVEARFGGTDVWPLPTEGDVERFAWAACAESVLALETAASHGDWIVVGHEQHCLDPLRAFETLFQHAHLQWTDRVADALLGTNRDGSGYETNRMWRDEPQRWRTRLSPSERETVQSTVARFEHVSPTAAAAWRSSPAIV